jgi:hypothetical protein
VGGDGHVACPRMMGRMSVAAKPRWTLIMLAEKPHP